MERIDNQPFACDRLAHSLSYCHARSLALGVKDGMKVIDSQSFSSCVGNFIEANGGVGDSFWRGVLLRVNTSPSPYDQNKKPSLSISDSRSTNRASEAILGGLEGKLVGVMR